MVYRCCKVYKTNQTCKGVGIQRVNAKLRLAMEVLRCPAHAILYQLSEHFIEVLREGFEGILSQRWLLGEMSRDSVPLRKSSAHASDCRGIRASTASTTTLSIDLLSNLYIACVKHSMSMIRADHGDPRASRLPNSRRSHQANINFPAASTSKSGLEREPRSPKLLCNTSNKQATLFA